MTLRVVYFQHGIFQKNVFLLKVVIVKLPRQVKELCQTVSQRYHLSEGLRQKRRLVQSLRYAFRDLQLTQATNVTVKENIYICIYINVTIYTKNIKASPPLKDIEHYCHRP